MDSPLIIKLKTFALEVIKVCNEVKQTKRESVLTNQFLRSGQVLVQTSERHFTLTEKPEATTVSGFFPSKNKVQKFWMPLHKNRCLDGHELNS